MKNKIEQFPKNKSIDKAKLSDEMKALRANIYIEKYKGGIRCRCCAFLQKKEEFYIKDKETGRRNTKCRDCCLKDGGTIEIGKRRLSKILFDKNIRVCSICKTPKSLTEFPKKAGSKGGISNSCLICTKKIFHDITIKYKAKETTVKCYVCKLPFKKGNGEIKRTAVHYCSRECYFKSDLIIKNILK